MLTFLDYYFHVSQLHEYINTEINNVVRIDVIGPAEIIFEKLSTVEVASFL